MTKPRIILLTSKLDFLTAGGSVHDLDTKSVELIRRGFDVRVMTAYSKSNKLGDKKLSYGIIEENIDSGSLIALQRSTAKTLKKYENDTDIFYVEGQFGFGAGIYKLLGGKRPVLCFCNVEVSPWLDLPDNTPTIARGIKRLLRRAYENTVGAWLMNRLDYFIFTSPTVKKKFSNSGVRGEPYIAIPDFVNCDEIKYRTGVPHEQLKRNPTQRKTINILCSGRMIAEKGFDLIIKAVSEIHDKSRINVTMCGDGPEKEQLVRLAKQYGVEKHFEFVGWVDRDTLLLELAKTDIFILPRWRKHLTSVLLIEAMGLGAPSIVPGGGGLEWLAGDAALTFRFDDSHDLSDKIERLINDPAMRAQLSLSALHRAEEFSPKLMGEKMEKIINELVASSA